MREKLPSSTGSGSASESESGRKREILRRMLAQELLEPSQISVTRRAPDCRDAPASHAQEGIWFVDRLQPGTIEFNFAVPPLRFRGRLDVAALERALNEVVRRHEALRTTFVTRDGRPFQAVAPALQVALPVADLSAMGREERELELKQRIVREMEAPFDLSQGPLLRALLVRCDPQTHVLVIAVHHIVFDMGSVGILFAELSTIYRAFAEGRESPLPPLALQYGDFAAWQQQWIGSGALRKQLAYWKDKLADAQELRLPADRRRPATPSGRGMRETLLLSRELSGALKDLARREGVTSYVLLLAAFSVLIGRFAHQDDVVVGSPMTMRRRPEIEGLIGLFVNMVAMRANLSGAPTFRELVRRVRESALGALENSDAPFDHVVRQLNLSRGASRSPLLQATFGFEQMPTAREFDAGLDVEPMRSASGPGASGDGDKFEISLDHWLTRFDLEVYVRELHDELSVDFQGSTDLFTRDTLRSQLHAFRTLLQGIVANPNAPVTHLPLLDAAQLRVIVDERNRTARDYPRDSSVSALFEAQARLRPDAAAVEYGDDRLTYAELDARADRLAAALRRLGVGPGTAVGLSVPRSAGLVVGMLGILKAGGAYLPLDPDYPAERLEFMLKDTGADVIVTDSATGAQLAGMPARLLPLDSALADAGTARLAGPPPQGEPPGLAYIIFTSGSTGVPKGVQVTHRGIARLVCNTDYTELGPDVRMAQASTASFDAATYEIWAPLLNGGCVVGVPRDVALSPRELARFLRARRITHLFITTALFNQTARDVPDAFATLRALHFGGEAVSLDPVRAVLKAGAPRQFNHIYGPTEVTTFALTHRIESLDEAATTVPIGRPIANTTAYVLDERGEPVPDGMPGELYLGGDGVALGYMNREELTRERFMPDRFGPDPSMRLYRTGDWVRWGPGGAIEFIGRRDGQVKVRGFRIELGEIEAVLKRQPNLVESLVMVREDEPGDQRVVAYVVSRPHADPPVRAEGLRAALREHMPEYLVPSVFVILDSLPLKVNGKVDRDALPAPGASRPAAVEAAPNGELQERIAGVWRELLKVEKVGAQDNFFDIGGHSLLVVRMQARLRESLGIECELVDLFAYPTIESLCAFLQSESKAAVVADEAAARVARRAKASGTAEPIAIIGMAGRFPGAPDVEAFWRNLREGRECIRFFTPEELREAGVPESAITDPDYVPARGYLDDADKFDAGFFGFSAREAQVMDPQQRLLLECAQEALDRAGYDPERYPGAIGVFAGSTMSTYLAALEARHAVPDSVGGLSRVMASAQDFLTTRLSYKLNLRGPSVNVQTACSTSLVAVHQACRALLDYDCDMALAGGVSVTVPLEAGYMYVDEGIGSPDGHCRPFDASADGTVSGHGVGLVMLKRLSDALADGDHIHAVVRGTAINNDGSAKVGYTAPSVEGQAQAIAHAQATAECEPGSIDYVEAHGTGTHLGDPIEISALRRVFGEQPRSGGPCWIGAVKSNVGHLDAAAGVAGFIKAALSVEHGEIVPSLNFVRPNAQIDFAASPFEVSTRLRKWESRDGRPRRAGVSSFGLGGTNAHAVLEQAPPLAPPAPAPEWQLICLSAKTPDALERMGANLARHLRAHPELALADVAHTLQVGRREFAYRRVIVARTLEESAAALEPGAPDASSMAACKPGVRAPVFMFSGQGSQHPGMALGIYRREPVFRDTVDDCCARLAPVLGVDLRELLFPSTGAMDAASRRLENTRFAQPALFVVEYAAAKTWMAWGVRPAAMIGHSIGEYVAACVADVMDLDDALRLVAERGRLMSLQPPGAMTAVGMPEAELAPLLGTQLSLAAVNAPGLCVASGPLPAIERLEADLDARGLMPRRLHTSHAFHSSMMDPALEPFSAAVRAVALRPPRIPYISNVTGDWITDAQATDPGYYAAHLREAVRFSQGLERLFSDPDRVFVECGPGQTLASLARRHPECGAHACIASMRHPADARDDGAVWLEAAGRLWLAGVRPDWAAVQGGQRRRVVLPAYPFERTRYWLDAPRASRPMADEPLRRIADPKEWLYVPSWQRSAPRAAETCADGSSWLVFCDDHGMGTRLAAELRAAGCTVASVTSGPQYAALAADRYTVNPDSRADYDRLLADLRRASFVPVRIAHLGVMGPDADVRDDEAFGRACRSRGFYSVVSLIQALADANLDQDVRLAVVTSHAVEVDGRETICPDKAMAMAPCAVAGMEHPRIRARAIDVQVDGEPAALARLLARELLSPWGDAVVAYRGRHRWVRAFERVAAAPHDEALREGATYLITGGLGGVGLEIAAHFARRARANCVLLGRTGLPARDAWNAWLAGHPVEDPTARRIRRVRDIEAGGVTVLALQADVADEAQVAAAVAQAERRLGPIRGVVHAAGAEKVGEPIHSLARAACEAQFRPKVAGLRALEKAFDGRSLDFFLVHSSLASVTGVAGFVSYTASHAFMDAFVHRHNRGSASPWRTVNWDNWRLATEGAPATQGAEFFLTPEEACQALDRVLARPELAQVLVSTGPLQARIDRWLARDEPEAESAAAQPPAAKAHPRPALSSPFEAPRSEAERTLTAIWQDTLGIDGIGVHDNFFELGGDSVLNIQIIAKANRLGLRLTPRQVFENQTIAQLARLAGAGTAAALEPQEAAGPVPLTPIQAWFFERGLRRPEHFNLAMLLEVRSPLEASVLAKAAGHLARHHDALRLRFERTGGAWRQRLAQDAPAVSVERIDLSGLDAGQRRVRIEQAGSAFQKDLDIAAGRLMKLAIFDPGPGEPSQLLWIIHHLAVDMISWRILVEDLELACKAVAAGHEPLLPPRTVSFGRWSRALAAHAQTPAAEAQLGFWRDLGRPVARLPLDQAEGPDSVATARRIHESLGEEETRSLLTELPRAFGTRIDDALLFALGKALAGWTGSHTALVDFEGHGRDALLDGIDPSRTVGWFTSLSPVRLELPAGSDVAGQLAAVHRQLIAIPQHGMGFGILRYLSEKPAIREALAAMPAREVSFLYAGQFDQAFARDALFALAGEPPGELHDPDGERSHLLEVNSVVMQGRLHVTWTYGSNRHREQTIRALAQSYMEALRSLLARTRARAPGHLAYGSGVGPGAADMAEIARQLASAGEMGE